MHCPVCTTTNLMMTERQGIEIDYCPNCRGVWLDRGELDKILERTVAQENGPVSAQPTVIHQQQPQQQHRHHPDKAHHYGHGYGHHYKKKKSLLSELFDFD